MPTCHKCSEAFPNRITVGGRVRTLSNRKYCLNCSPLGVHNTRKVEVERCSSCIVCDGRHHLKSNLCRVCTTKIARWRMKLALVVAKGGKCERCGWSGHPVALDFHHLDPSQKEMGLNMSTTSCKAMAQEAEKCILLCARCHPLEHTGEIDPMFWEQVFKYRGALEMGAMEDWKFLAEQEIADIA